MKKANNLLQNPLNQSQYNIKIDNNIEGIINIKSKYWINNNSLNMRM